jgi:methyl-accepting chemotaxis protein
MAGKSGLDKAIAVFGIGVSAVGILLIIWLFFMFNGLIDSFHEIGIGQVDAAISVLENTRIVVNSTATSIDAFGEFTTDAYDALQNSADVMEGMSGAVNGLAGAVGSIPYMPADVTSSLYSSAADMDAAAASMQGTADSMEDIKGGALSATLGIGQMESDIESSIEDMQKTKRKLDEMQFTAKTGLILGSMLLVMLFALNGLTFYRQLRE